MFEVTQELIERQKRNEEDIIGEGIKKYRRNLEADTRKGNFGSTMVGSWLIKDYIDPLAKKFDEFVTEALEGKAGRRPAAALYLMRLPPETLAFITLKTLISCLAVQKYIETTCAKKIGAVIEEELQHSKMRKEKLKAYEYWTLQAARAKHPTTKKRCLDKLRGLFGPLPKIDEKTRIVIGETCIEQANNVAGLVRRYKTYRGKFEQIHITLADSFIEIVMDFNAEKEPLFPANEPMLCPPKPWDGAFGCGFVGELGARTKLLRSPNRKYLEEIHLNRDKLANVFSALNAIQATPWHINQKVLSTMRLAFSAGGNGFGLPPADRLPIPPRPHNADTNNKVRQQYAYAIREVQERNASDSAQRVQLSYALSTAEKYKEEEAIYFPHNLDWRGRIYPIASHLSPQGSETVRSLLEFARGMPIGTKEAAGWLAIHGTGCWGYDKVSFEERMQWVKDHEEQIREAAANPLDYRWWTEADSPWMFLAWCFDWAGYLENGLAHVSRLPVCMDGSCNGLQNFAAMLRHEGTARAVNLAPSDRPNDIYQQVANIVSKRVDALAAESPLTSEELKEVIEKRTVDEFNAAPAEAKADDGKKKRGRKAKPGTQKEAPEVKEARKETGRLWNILAAKWMSGQISRSLVKQPVMTYPYAVTESGVKTQLTNKLKELSRAGKVQFPDGHASKVAFMLKTVVYQTVREEVRAAAVAMDWLKKVAEEISKYNRPICWFSPIGLLVVQDYKQETAKRIRTAFGGVRVEQSYYEKTNQIEPQKQMSAIAPNFVHSCDASHLMKTVNACLDHGLVDFNMIHDSYGTHAANAPLLARTLRQEFVNIYSGNVLEKFHQELSHFIPESELRGLTPPPEQGNFDLLNVLESRYFFI